MSFVCFVAISCRHLSPAENLDRACHQDNEGLARDAIAKHVDINVPNGAGWTPLHEAVSHHAIHVAKLLIENGANLNAQSRVGLTPIMMAAENNDKAEVQLLLSKGARTDIRTQRGSDVFGFAKTFGDHDLQQALGMP